MSSAALIHVVAKSDSREMSSCRLRRQEGRRRRLGARASAKSVWRPSAFYLCRDTHSIALLEAEGEKEKDTITRRGPNLLYIEIKSDFRRRLL